MSRAQNVQVEPLELRTRAWTYPGPGERSELKTLARKVNNSRQDPSN